MNICRCIKNEYNGTPAYCRISLCCILPTAESHSAVSFLLQNLTMLFPAYCRISLCCDLPKADSHSDVSCLLLNRTFQFPAYCWVRLRCVLPTTELESSVSYTYHWVGLYGVLHTAESYFVVSCLLLSPSLKRGLENASTLRCFWSHQKIVWYCLENRTSQRNST